MFITTLTKSWRFILLKPVQCILWHGTSPASRFRRRF